MSTEPKCSVCGGWQNPDALHTNTTDCINFIDRQLALFKEIQIDQQRETARLINIKESIEKASHEPTAIIVEYIGVLPDEPLTISKTLDDVVKKFFTSIDETVKVK